MKKYLTITALIGIIVLAGIVYYVVARTNAAQEQAALALPLPVDYVSVRPQVMALPLQTISFEELDGLVYMREEEKLARDVYTTLYEVWKLPLFSNIAQSEQTHTEAVRTVLAKYAIDDPVTDDSIGAFTDPEFTKFYADFTTRGEESLVDALTVGARIEELDIRDLESRLAATNNEDITLVYENLMRGSRNHLRSFVSQLEARGETFVPQYLSQEDYDAIVTTERETGARAGWGARSR